MPYFGGSSRGILAVGLVKGAGDQDSCGINITVSNSTLSVKGASRNRGLGMEVGDGKSGVISNNTLDNGSTASWNGAILLGKGTAGGNPNGINSLKFIGNDANC